MFAVTVDSNGSIIRRDLMTLTVFKETYITAPNVYFVDRSNFYNDSEIAFFLKNTASYFVDADGYLRRNYNNNTNTITPATYSDMNGEIPFGSTD